jgi:hypothetical protein
MKNTLLFLVFVVGVTGCASQIETVRVDPETLQAIGKGIEGVMYYEPKLFKVRYEFTQLVDEKGELIGSSYNHNCEQVVQKVEIVTLPDYHNPRAILHKPSPFSSSEFGVTLNNGMLTGVTSNSTPHTAPILEQIIKATQVPKATEVGKPSTAACNAGPVIAATDPVEY